MNERQFKQHLAAIVERQRRKAEPVAAAEQASAAKKPPAAEKPRKATKKKRSA